MLTSTFSIFIIEKKNKKGENNLAEKEKMEKPCIKYKQEYDNQGKVEKYSGERESC